MKNQSNTLFVRDYEYETRELIDQAALQAGVEGGQSVYRYRG